MFKFCSICRYGRRFFQVSSKLVSIVSSTVKRLFWRQQRQRRRGWSDDGWRSVALLTHVRPSVAGVAVEVTVWRLVLGHSLGAARINRPTLIIRCTASIRTRFSPYWIHEEPISQSIVFQPFRPRRQQNSAHSHLESLNFRTMMLFLKFCVPANKTSMLRNLGNSQRIVNVVFSSK